jgi:hypothetical protein
MDIKEERIGNYILRMFYDECPTDPREDFNLSKMVCFHKRHSLGDDHDIKFDDAMLQGYNFSNAINMAIKPERL